MIDERLPVADGFELLPQSDLLGAVQLIKSAVFDGADQLGDGCVEDIEGLIQPTARFARRC